MMGLEIITKTKLICIPDDQVSFNEAAKEVLKIRKKILIVTLKWNGMEFLFQSNHTRQFQIV
jgi:hypothetical protein